MRLMLKRVSNIKDTLKRAPHRVISNTSLFMYKMQVLSCPWLVPVISMLYLGIIDGGSENLNMFLMDECNFHGFRYWVGTYKDWSYTHGSWFGSKFLLHPNLVLVLILFGTKDFGYSNNGMHTCNPSGEMLLLWAMLVLTRSKPGPNC